MARWVGGRVCATAASTLLRAPAGEVHRSARCRSCIVALISNTPARAPASVDQWVSNHLLASAALRNKTLPSLHRRPCVRDTSRTDRRGYVTRHHASGRTPSAIACRTMRSNACRTSDAGAFARSQPKATRLAAAGALTRTSTNVAPAFLRARRRRMRVALVNCQAPLDRELAALASKLNSRTTPLCGR